MTFFSTALLAQESYADVPAIFGLDPGMIFVLAMALVGCVTAIVIVSICTVAGRLKNRDELRFKQDLIDRGMSAEEIDQVVRATPPGDWLERWAEGRKK